MTTLQPTSTPPGTGSALWPVGPHLVIAPEEAEPALTAALSGQDPLPDAVLVLAAAPDAAPVLRRSLRELVHLATGRGATRLVLAASGLAAPGPDRRRPVETVAAAAGFPVIAPDGVVTVEPDGSVQVTPPGTWWLTEPGVPPRPLAPAWPPAVRENGAGGEDEGEGDNGEGHEGEGHEGEGHEGEGHEGEEVERPGRVPSPDTAPLAPQAAPAPPTLSELEPLEALSPAAGPHTDVPVTEPVDPGAGTAHVEPPPLAPPVPVVAESPGGAHGFEIEPVGAEPGAESRPEPRAVPRSEPRSESRPESRPESGAEPGHRPVPGGFWLGEVPEGVEALIGVRPGDLLLGVGSPRRPVLPSADLLDLVREAAPEPDGLLLTAPWADPAELIGMAVALAARLGRNVRAAVGLPVRTADGHDHATSLLDQRGGATWQPMLVELTASPGHRRVVPSAWLRLPGLDTLAPAVHRTGSEGWVLETVPAGLWLRPAGRSANPWPRMLRPDPARPVLVVGDRDRAIAPEVWEALPGVLAALPDLGAIAPYGLLVNGKGADGAAARAWAGANGLDWLGPTSTDSAPAVPAPASSAPATSAPAVPAPVSSAPAVPAPATSVPATSVPAVPAPADEDSSMPDPAAEAAAPPPFAASTETAPGAAGRSTPAALGPTGRSRPEDRAALKDLLGPRYHLVASKTELLASRLPALRSTLQDDLKPDMVAIALYQADTPAPASRADLVATARATEPGPLTPLLRCLGSGLRRLPGHYGAVMLAAPAEEVPLDQYMPGSVLVEPAPVAAVPACDADLEGSVEFGIWSTTGRRTSLFAGPDAEPEVVFPPGTAFSVLALRPPADDEGPIRVLLREISPAEARPTGRGTTASGAADDRSRERDEQARSRLTSWFERRDMLAPQERRSLPDATRFHLSPGATLRRTSLP
ncbi:hypothetical protein ACWFQ8_12230 [Streptomyces sp. NPDC055254]